MRHESLYINGSPARVKGIVMGDNFLSNLEKPLEMKDFIKNESRLEDGVRMIPANPKLRSRSITLTFNIHGSTPSEYHANKKWLEEQFYYGNDQGYVDITTKTHFGITTYHLIYTGKSITYDEGGAHKDGKITVGFEEPNPRKRD